MMESTSIDFGIGTQPLKLVRDFQADGRLLGFGQRPKSNHVQCSMEFTVVELR